MFQKHAGSAKHHGDGLSKNLGHRAASIHPSKDGWDLRAATRRSADRGSRVCGRRLFVEAGPLGGSENSVQRCVCARAQHHTQQLLMAEMRGSIRHLVLIAMTPQAFGVGRELQRTSWGVLGLLGLQEALVLAWSAAEGAGMEGQAGQDRGCWTDRCSPRFFLGFSKVSKRGQGWLGGVCEQMEGG
ncbi:hypothetical protein FALCPG4_006661 [Fusarium falciforme]